MAYSPYMPRTPQSTRTRGSFSAPATPRLGHAVDHQYRSHRYASRLMHNDSNSDGSVGWASPAHKSSCSTQSYGTLQTDISNSGCTKAAPKAAPKAALRPQVVVELSTPSDYDDHKITTLCKPLAWIWVIINIATSGMILFCLLQPHWLVNSETKASLGVFNYCDGLVFLDLQTENCKFYYKNDESSGILWTLPSLPWKVGAILYIIACALLVTSSLLASLCLCIPNISIVNRISLVAGLQQLTAGILLLTALVTLPVGFDAEEVKKVCGAYSGIYKVANCNMGWSYILSTICSILCFSLPILSHYITHVPTYSTLL